MSKQPHKQRNRTERAPLHERHDQVHATLNDDLREEFDRRSVRVRTGDTAEVMRGDFAGEEADVTAVDLKDVEVFLEDVTVEAADGEEVQRPLDASNLRVVDLDRSDPERIKRLEES